MDVLDGENLLRSWKERSAQLGCDEIIAGGINDQFGPWLAVFDSNHVAGCTRQSGEFRSDSLPAGSEEYYLVLPRPEVGLARGDIVEAVNDLGITGNKRVVVDYFYNLFFYPGLDLRCQYVDWGHCHRMKRNEIAAAGKLRGISTARTAR